MAETPVYTPDEYTESFIDFGRPFKIDFGSTAPTSTSLAKDTGISNIIEPQKLDTNPAINKLIDPNNINRMMKIIRVLRELNNTGPSILAKTMNRSLDIFSLFKNSVIYEGIAAK